MKDNKLLNSETYSSLDLNDYKWVEQAIETSKQEKQRMEVQKSINKHIKTAQECDMSIADIIDMVANDIVSIMRK